MAAFMHRFWKGNTPMNILVNDLAVDGPDDICLVEVRLHLSAASGVQSFTVTVGSNDGTEYDAVLSSTAMNGLTDKYLTDWNIIRAKDHITFALANALALTWGLEMIYGRASEIY
jgi:hypothetical protein